MSISVASPTQLTASAPRHPQHLLTAPRYRFPSQGLLEHRKQALKEAPYEVLLSTTDLEPLVVGSCFKLPVDVRLPWGWGWGGGAGGMGFAAGGDVNLLGGAGMAMGGGVGGVGGGVAYGGSHSGVIQHNQRQLGKRDVNWLYATTRRHTLSALHVWALTLPAVDGELISDVSSADAFLSGMDDAAAGPGTDEDDDAPVAAAVTGDHGADEMDPAHPEALIGMLCETLYSRCTPVRVTVRPKARNGLLSPKGEGGTMSEEGEEGDGGE